MNSQDCVKQENETIWRNAFNTIKNINYDDKNITNSNNGNTPGETTIDPDGTCSTGFATNYLNKQQLNNRNNFYYKLAEESPKNDCDSDYTFSSIHGEETEFCKDTSDTDSCTTTEENTIAMMEVIEYEIASTESEDSLYSDDSSSGTNDQVLEAVARALYESSSSTSDLLADDEELDGPTDPELKHADYWECVKCKNKQNNPMYRYCERCYQIRKNHFPPRPKKFLKRRKRNTLREATNSLPFSKSTPNRRKYNQQISRCSSLNSSSRSVSSNDNLTDDNITIKKTKKLHQPFKTLSSPAFTTRGNIAPVVAEVTTPIEAAVTPNNGNIHNSSLKLLRNKLNTTPSSTTTNNCPSITTSSNISSSSSPQSKIKNNLFIKQQHEQQRLEQHQEQQKHNVEHTVEKVNTNNSADYSTVSEDDDVDFNDADDFFQLTSTPNANDDLLLNGEKCVKGKELIDLSGNRNCFLNNNLLNNNNNNTNVSSYGNKKLDQHVQNKVDDCASEKHTLEQTTQQLAQRTDDNFIKVAKIFNLFRKHKTNTLSSNNRSSTSSYHISLPSSSLTLPSEPLNSNAMKLNSTNSIDNENSTKKYSLDNMEYLLLKNQSDNIIKNNNVKRVENINATTELIKTKNNVSSQNCSSNSSSISNNNNLNNSNYYRNNNKRKLSDYKEDSEVLIDNKKLCKKTNNNESKNVVDDDDDDDILQNNLLNDCYDGVIKEVNGVCSDKRIKVVTVSSEELNNKKKSSLSSTLSLMSTGKLDYLGKDSGISSCSSSLSSTSSQEIIVRKKSLNSFNVGNGGGGGGGVSNSTMSQETYCSDYETIAQNSSQETVVDELIKNKKSVFILDELHVDANNGDILEKNYPSSVDDDVLDDDDDDEDGDEDDVYSDVKASELLNNLSTLSEPCNGSNSNLEMNTNTLRSKSSLDYNSLNKCNNTINRSFSDNENSTTDALVAKSSVAVAIRKSLPAIQLAANRKSIGVSSIEQYIEPCIVCLSRPKDAAFIHSKFAHICCCYKCAVKVWNKRKLCPICNCRVKNVMKFYVH